jgi:hypothetical protein
LTDEEAPNMSGFFQKPQFNAFERIICSHLLEAVNAEPLITVSHITRAVLAIDEASAKKLDISKKKALSIYTVAQRLTTATKKTDKWGYETYSVNIATLPWGDVESWKVPDCYSWRGSDEESDKITQAIEDEDERGAFLQSAKILSASGFSNMTSDFLSYAVPVVEEMSRKLSSLVSPETYTELMALYHGEKN